MKYETVKEIEEEKFRQLSRVKIQQNASLLWESNKKKKAKGGKKTS